MALVDITNQVVNTRCVDDDHMVCKIVQGAAAAMHYAHWRGCAPGYLRRGGTRTCAVHPEDLDDLIAAACEATTRRLDCDVCTNIIVSDLLGNGRHELLHPACKDRLMHAFRA